ncbi:MAG: N-acetylmuramoyl-L-alanine amidase, partial [Lachnospiraceae bacterium]|nr:N-acetylmuramoyl-L-alanine amidase [Lachnospiraceae bacterium]
DYVLDEVTAATGAKKQYVWETDTMTGINWAQVPSTILEMGYMTNADEDLRMASDDYQDTIAEAVADAVDLFLQE